MVDLYGDGALPPPKINMGTNPMRWKQHAVMYQQAYHGQHNYSKKVTHMNSAGSAFLGAACRQVKKLYLSWNANVWKK